MLRITRTINLITIIEFSDPHLCINATKRDSDYVEFVRYNFKV